MSTGNPKKAIAAILPPSLDVGGFTVRPMTLGMFAALERIDSPLVTGEDAKDTLSLIPSLYLLTHDPREIFAGNLLDRALVWADTVPVETMAEIRAACAQQLQTMLDVIPQRDDDEKKKEKGNDGWIARLIHFAAAEFGWSFRDILWEVPASAILLLYRQDALDADKIFPLSVIEEIDNGRS